MKHYTGLDEKNLTCRFEFVKVDRYMKHYTTPRQTINKRIRSIRARTRLHYLSTSDLAMRRARIDDFCAKNGIETIKCAAEPLPEDPKWSLWGP